MLLARFAVLMCAFVTRVVITCRSGYFPECFVQRIDDTWIIKVADFGLTRDTGDKDYFRQGKDEGVKLPIKWMALESLEECVFSEKSDVWSFGVTMWEIFTGGNSPFEDAHPLTLVGAIRNGEKLQKPENLACNDEIYSVMLDCWLVSAKDRPSFKQLNQKLTYMIQSMTEYLEIITFEKKDVEYLKLSSLSNMKSYIM